MPPAPRQPLASQHLMSDAVTASMMPRSRATKQRSAPTLCPLVRGRVSQEDRVSRDGAPAVWLPSSSRVRESVPDFVRV